MGDDGFTTQRLYSVDPQTEMFQLVFVVVEVLLEMEDVLFEGENLACCCFGSLDEEGVEVG